MQTDTYTHISVNLLLIDFILITSLITKPQFPNKTKSKQEENYKNK